MLALLGLTGSLHPGSRAYQEILLFSHGENDDLAKFQARNLPVRPSPRASADARIEFLPAAAQPCQHPEG